MLFAKLKNRTLEGAWEDKLTEANAKVEEAEAKLEEAEATGLTAEEINVL